MNAKAREFLFPDRFTPVGDLLRQQALSQPERPALRDQHRSLSYLELDQLCDRIASALQRDGIGSGQSIGICALNSVSYAALFLGALRAGVVVAPIAPSSSADAVHAMLTDAGAEMVFVDAAAQSLLAESGSPGMMTGYHNQPGKTAEAEWYDSKGKRFIRTGDIGKFDEDGFLVLMDRRKDMIISGGFNVYPSDLEAILQQHPAIAEAAVVGVPSEQWGETPVAYIVGKPAMPVSTAELLNWFNARCGKTQRLSDLKTMDELPRSAIGKILKRELRERYLNQQDN